MIEQIGVAVRESFSRVLAGLASILPAAVAMLLTVVVAVAIGGAMGWLLSRVLRRLEFDQRLDQWGLTALAEWSPDRSPTRLVAWCSFWVVLLVGVLVGLAALEQPLMATMVGRLIAYLPNVFVAVLLLLAGAVLARFLSRGVLISAVNLQLQSAGLISVGVKWLIRILSVAMALEHLSIGGDILKLAFGIMFGGIVLTLALAVGLGSKELVSRSWERQTERKTEPAETPYQHL